ncbi:uncharacterized protein LOC123038055 [Drosophila rhopaloa]|uniref:RNA-directed DNA polymerase n=1 Tax=Drosophila rhopaloa TaxID=1041015 RepID=A0ABM5JF51_DRORH|nr:uncharacterized protein LOC123038055 [Drosophila rhopaloa]
MNRFQRVFARSDDDSGHTNLTRHVIDTGLSRPIKQPVRRLALARKAEVEELVADMKLRGIIRPSTSPWASPVVLVRKKDGSTRFCVDYRRLNDITIKDSYPLPRMDDILTTMHGAYWFSTMDLQSGYWQVEMDDTSRAKTAFTCDAGLFEFNVMPFGLTNAPATFERLMDGLFSGPAWKYTLVYLDDIIVYSRTAEDHLDHLQQVLDKLQSAGLKLSPRKCHFFRTFETLKIKLTTPPILTFPTSNGVFVLDTDASNHGAGAVLSQQQEGQEHVLEYYSKSFNAAERNYCDNSLAGLNASSNTTWISSTTVASCTVTPTPCLAAPVAFSRICTKAEQNDGQGILFLQAQPVDIAISQEKDPTLSLILQWLKTGERPTKSTTWSESPETKAYWHLFEHLFVERGLLMIKTKTADEALVVPRSLQEEALRSTHNSTTGGHFGIKKTVAKLKQRRNFESEVFQACLRLLDVEKTRTTPLHPQSDGMVERFNRTLLDYLAKFVATDQRDWDQLLPLALWAYRSAPHKATGFSPSLLLLGRELRLPSELLYGRPSPHPESYPAYVEQLQNRLRLTQQIGRRNLMAAANVNKLRYDLRSHPVEFAVGEEVWLYCPTRRVGRCPKLQSDWIGPAVVTRRHSDLVYKIRLPGKRATRTVHVNRLAPYRGPSPAVLGQETRV